MLYTVDELDLKTELSRICLCEDIELLFSRTGILRVQRTQPLVDIIQVC